MTSRTSLFNAGIFRSTVRRYRLGALLYAIILFMCTGLSVLFSVDPENHWMAQSEHNYDLILRDTYLYFPLVISVAVPTVVALLVYRFVHSKKSSIFIHSLPVSRTANYISSLAAALTLMAAPVIFNGAILALISVCGWGEIFSVGSCVTWTLINLLSLFLMFSAATFCAFLTGNSFALIALNILIHLIAIIVAGSFSTLADTFLYGYNGANTLLNAVAENNFVVYVFGIANRIGDRGVITFDFAKLFVMMACAIIFYVAALVLYKKRRMETAEDVAAYKILNPVFKYLVTFLAAIGTFGICSYELRDGVFYPIFIVLLVSAIVYFALDMLLKKSLRVRGAYKGYVAFLAAFAVLICTFAFTSWFGFETRVPEHGDIVAVSVRNSLAYEEIPYVENAEIIDYAIEVHSELVERENITTLRDYNDAHIYVDYRLKNGKTLSRRYSIEEEKFCRIMNRLYEWRDYKTSTLDIFSDKIGEINNIEISHGEHSVTGSREIAELIACLQADYLALRYTETRNHEAWDTNIWVNYIPADEMEQEIRGLHQLHCSINASFKHTIAWLSKRGLLDNTFNPSGYDLAVVPAEQWDKYNGMSEKERLEYAAGVGNSYGEVTVEAVRNPMIQELEGVRRISDAETKRKLREFVQTTPVDYVSGKDYSYYVVTVEPTNSYVNIAAAFYEDAKAIERFMG